MPPEWPSLLLAGQSLFQGQSLSTVLPYKVDQCDEEVYVTCFVAPFLGYILIGCKFLDILRYILVSKVVSSKQFLFLVAFLESPFDLKISANTDAMAGGR